MVEEAFAERLWGEIDWTLEPYDVSEWYKENLKRDLITSLTVMAEPRPGYEPGAVAPITFNIADFLTQPGKTLWKTVVTPFTDEFRELGPTAVSALLRPEPESAVWARLMDDQGAWIDPVGLTVVPRSLREAVLRWQEGAPIRIVRLTRERILIRTNPGAIKMFADPLLAEGWTHVDGFDLAQIREEARQFDRALSNRFARADYEEGIGKIAEADRLRAEASLIQSGEVNIDPQTGAIVDVGGVSWTETSAYKSRKKVFGEFEKAGRFNPAISASPEAQFWRYWKNRNLYYTTLNVLDTYHKHGIKGVIYQYGWQAATRRIFAKGTRRYYLYPPNLIAEGMKRYVAPVLKPALTKLTAARTTFARALKKYVYQPAGKLLAKIAAKLGLKALMAKLGGLVGAAAGGPVGAVVGATASFVGGLILEKTWKPLLKGLIYGVVGVIGCLFIFLFLGAIGISLLFASFFAPGAGGGPGPGPGPAPAQVEVEKVVCRVAGGLVLGGCSSWLNVENPEDGLEVEWRVSVKNNTSDSVDMMVMDERCYPLTGSKSLTVEAGEEKLAFSCRESFPVGTEDTTVTNVTEGTAPLGVTVQWGTATLVIGEAEACTVAGVPYYCQCYEDYSGVVCRNYTDGRTVCSFGCGPASEAMLINYHCGGEVTDPGEIARIYGCGYITAPPPSTGATRDILGGGLSTGSFGSGDDFAFFAPLLGQLCAGRPVITTISHPEITSGHISFIVGIDMARGKIILNDSYVSCVLPGGEGAYAEYDFVDYRGWVNTSTYWYWGGTRHPVCSP